MPLFRAPRRPRYRYIVLRSDHGQWERMVGYWRTREEAEQWVDLLSPLLARQPPLDRRTRIIKIIAWVR